ncbi:MAG TPA: hypothetical protein VMS38_32370 [Pseudorhodoferax sp.]|nr:hypothetical protein [Pseudorhodoferax sp.]
MKRTTKPWLGALWLLAGTAAAHTGHGSDGTAHVHSADVLRDALILGAILVVAALSWHKD